MLSPLPVLPYGVGQDIVAGDIANRLFRTVSNIIVASIEGRGRWILGLYDRLNMAGLNEAGLFCGFGPNCEEPTKWLFELLRFFSAKDECYDTAIEHYVGLAEKYELTVIAQNINPDDL